MMAMQTESVILPVTKGQATQSLTKLYSAGSLLSQRPSESKCVGAHTKQLLQAKFSPHLSKQSYNVGSVTVTSPK